MGTRKLMWKKTLEFEKKCYEITQIEKVYKIVLNLLSILDLICIVYSDKTRIHTYILLTIKQAEGYTPDKRFRK